MSFCTTSRSRSFFALTAITLVASFSLQAQVRVEPVNTNSKPTLLAETAGDPAIASTPQPKPQRTWHDTAIPTDKLISAQVREGILTIDGLVAKVQLNYSIHDAGYLYFYLPGVGTAIISHVEMPNSVKVKDAFHGANLAFTAGGHSFDLSSQGTILSEDKGKADLYVHFDPNTNAIAHYPMMGFGTTTGAPYTWPLSAPTAKDTSAHIVQPPPMPKSLLPRVQTNSTVSNVVKAEDIPQSSIATSNGR